MLKENCRTHVRPDAGNVRGVFFSRGHGTSNFPLQTLGLHEEIVLPRSFSGMIECGLYKARVPQLGVNASRFEAVLPARLKSQPSV